MALPKELGLEATAEADLLWVAAKCTTAEGKTSPVAAWAARPYYAALVGIATSPAWPLSAAQAEPPMRNGWYRATSSAPFAAQNAAELTTTANELLIIAGDEFLPDGWIKAARGSDPSVTGLVPKTFVISADVVVVAAAGYDGVVKGDLSFKRGDTLLVRPGSLPAQAWWLGSAGGQRGYLPRYMLDPSWRVRGRLAVAFIWAQYKLYKSRAGERKLRLAAARARAPAKAATDLERPANPSVDAAPAIASTHSDKAALAPLASLVSAAGRAALDQQQSGAFSTAPNAVGSPAAVSPAPYSLTSQPPLPPVQWRSAPAPTMQHRSAPKPPPGKRTSGAAASAASSAPIGV